MYGVKTFGFFRIKNNWFVFRQISFLQKLVFLFFYVCFIFISTVFMICVPIIAISEHDSLKTIFRQYDLIFSDIMCSLVFGLFVKYNYRLAWWDPLVECGAIALNKYPDYKKKYWKTRQNIIDKLKDIDENM